jgi:amidase
MPVALPNREEMKEIGAACGLNLSADEIEAYLSLMPTYIASYNTVDGMADVLPPVRYPRAPGYRPKGADNPLNGWAWKATIKGAPEGPLKGLSVALKDNVMVAGMPMSNGTRHLENYVPELDATVVTRLLDAGATVLGKAECECLCLSGASHTGAHGPVHNPRKPGHSAGGSSSGSAALVGAGVVDLALGCDQGGSIRMPAAYSGVCGLKPTWGLVPYSGIMPIEMALDHAGPITRTVRDNARMLQAIAGPDEFDPRQPKLFAPPPYAALLEGGAAGLRIAVVKEGFGWPNAEADVEAKVRAAAGLFAKLGAQVEEISIPLHRQGIDIWQPIALDGLSATLMGGEGFGSGRPDLYVTSLMAHHARWREQAASLAPTVKLLTMLGHHIRKLHGLHYYGKAMNLSRRLRAAYDAALKEHDILLMPTVPLKATKLPTPDAGPIEVVRRAHELLFNTAPFNATHHPALSIPCGLSDGLPIGLQLIGRHFDEVTLYRAAHAFEQAADWTTL